VESGAAGRRGRRRAARNGTDGGNGSGLATFPIDEEAAMADEGSLLLPPGAMALNYNSDSAVYDRDRAFRRVMATGLNDGRLTRRGRQWSSSTGTCSTGPARTMRPYRATRRRRRPRTAAWTSHLQATESRGKPSRAPTGAAPSRTARARRACVRPHWSLPCPLRLRRFLTCAMVTALPAGVHGQPIHAPLAHAQHQEAPARA
jgi:hypothetical protein